MIFITDELGKFEKNIIELAENVGFKECKTIEAIDLFCGISEKNDVLKEKDRYYAFIDIPQYWSVRADELVLSGASMGTFGSLYYGSKLSPHALLLAKPLANMGNVARNERILRAGGFATSLDILMKNYDNLSDEAIEQLNNRMWDRFDSADWSHTKFIISYLYEDDYDPDGYPSILSHLKSSGVEVYGKGSHGRHTDNSANVMAWFKSQYNNLLHDDFSR